MKTKSLLTLICGLFFFFAKAQVAPVFTSGTIQTLSVCENSGANVIDSKMVTSDPDAGQTLTYTIATAPVHGTVHGFPGLTSTGAGGIVSPSGFDYTPTNGYSGTDSFVVNVNDGTFSAQTKIRVTINALPTVATIGGTASACIGNTSQLTNATTGGVWSSSNVFVADISNTGLVTAQAAGTATVSYTVTNSGTGCSNAATVSFQVAGPPVVNAIAGTTTVCAGSTTQLSSTTSGGVWTSNNTTRATVNSSTGLVTGVAGGNVTITYTVTNGVGCSNFVTASVTVNNRPNVSSISGTTTTICVGSTTTLTDATNGGVWSSSNTSVATVSNVGLVTGVSTGISTISYTVTNGNGCTNAATVDITIATAPNVSPITGPTAVCVGKSITLSDATNGGTWSVNNPTRATISSGGVLTGVGAGAVVVTYSVTGASGCAKNVTYNVIVNAAVSLSAISGSNQICVGTNTTLSNSTGGGTWTSSNTSIATVNSGGVVTGVAAGNDTITYKVVNASGCSDSVKYAITVTSSITVAPILGGSSVCLGSTLLLTCATTSGVWNSSDLSVATVVNGTVYPISAGIVAITYTVGSGACSGVSTKNIIVNPSPTVGAISGTTAICVGTTSQLSNATSGGTWISSNTNTASVSNTGLVTPGNFGGNATITYTVTNSYGCTQSATANVTINNRPNVNAITGINSTCVNSTTQLACTTTGGTWSSSNTSVGIVTSTGLVIGLSAGTDTISYTVTNGNGCITTVTRVVTIDAALVVAPITGSTTVCIGVTPNPTFSDATTNGTWSSSNTAVLSINATNGQATGLATGTATITYTVNNGGACTASSTLNVTVAARPNQPTVSGPTSVCVDASITLTGAPTGGKWVSQQTNFLTIDSSTGVATGVASIGFPTNVTYTVTNAAGCTRTSNNYGVTVNAGPAISQITPNGGVSVCVGATTTLANATTGGEWASSNTAIATINATTGVVTGVANGNILITYTVTNATGCASVATKFMTVNTTPTVNTTTGLTSVCAGSSTTLYNATPNGNWSSSNTAVATVSNTGAVTGVAAGTCNINYTVSSGGAGGCTATSTTAFTVNPVPVVGPIVVPTGVQGVCVGSSVQLSNATSGGNWTSSSNTKATVDNTGLVTGVGAGSIIISYTVSSGGCSGTVFSNGVVFALPTVAAIAGSSAICVGKTTTFTNDTIGGVWSSDNAAVASIDASGVVTANAAGTAIISYTKTNSNGCVKVVTKTITVNALPTIAAITNNNPICVFATNTLANATSGGVWVSANTAIATVDASSGLVTGVAGGVAAIKYIVTNVSGCSDSVSTNVTVNALPLVGTIGGSNAVCVFNTVALTNSATGGVWSSSNTTVATITAGGIVSGLAAGTSVIKYIVTNGSGCKDSATVNLTVNALPTVAAITGNTPVCVGSTRALANATTGGVWTSNNSLVATVNASGNVLGISAGTATIKYQVTNASGCVDSATTTITVNALPTVAPLIGTNTVCVGLTTTYSSTTTGGVWNSSIPAIATVSGGVINGVSAGNSSISYAVTNASGCVTTVTRTVTVFALPTVAAITGATAVCINSNTTFTSTTTGGVWTSSNTAIATINSSTGVITGVAAGTSTITYTVSNANGCINTATKTITVNALPAAVAVITGTNNVCVGLTTTLSTSTTGGVWSSDNTAIATITSGGVVSGVAVGTATITYTVTNVNGCVSTASTSVTVNALPTVAAITGATAVCVNANTTYASATTGGVWSSGTTFAATINSSTGVITGFNAGTSVISYTVTNANGCISTVTKTITVNALPTLSIISGNTSVCIGSTTTLFNTQTGGTWSSNATNIATINASSGVVTGVAAGNATITYSYTNANNCSNSITTSVTVNALPVVASITGSSSVCLGSTTTFANTTTGGSWFSSNTNVATIDNAGLITTVAVGNTTISYIVVNANNCVTTVTKSIIVKATSTSTTNTSICPSALPFTWNGLTFNAAGSQTAHLTNAAGCDSAATLILTVKANTTSTTNTSICPSALPFVWNGLTFNATGTQTAHLTNAAGCDSAATLNLTVKTNTSSSTSHTACTSYLWNGTTYTTSGTKTFTTTNSQGCDSVASLVLTINSVSTSTTDISICPSALPYSWNGLTFNAGGSQTAHLTNAVGCDSAAILNLTVKANTTSITNTSICPSELPYSWNGLTFNGAGSQTAHLTNAVGCDSAATLNLTVKANTTSITNTSICPSDLPFTWNGLTFNAAGSQTAHLTNAAGCDSAATLNLTVKANTTSTTDISICPSALPYSWNGLTFNAAGTQTAHLTNAAGCDSAATLNLTVKTNTSSSTNHTACTSYLWNGTTYTASGTYTFNTTNSQGCDSVATLVLTINSVSTSTTDISICPSELPYSWNGLTFNAGGSQTAHLTNAVSCDSAATLNLTVKANTTSTTDISICPSDLPYSWNGLTFNAAGSQTAHLTNAVACDSAATLNLTVKANTTSTTDISICPSDLPYSWNGLTFNAAGSQTAHLTNAVACDSAATLNLTVKANTTSTTDISICPSELPYSWNGLTFNAAGIQTAHLTNAAGCDSAATLNLIVKANTTSTTNKTICASELPYSWNALTFNAAGSQTAHFTNAVGCDSAATLNLTVKANTTSTTDISICPSELPYSWNGLTFNAAGIQTAHLTNAAGCDSAATLNLIVKANTTSTTNKTICASELPYSWNALTFNAAGSQTAHFTNAVGCDSAATLNLTVNANPIVPAINGTKSVCVNGTTPLSNTAIAGVWSSSNTSAATVDNSGVVSGIAAGTSTISYTVTNANNCSTTATAVVTVNALPIVDTITGSHQVCVTSTKVLGNATTGGVWSSLTPFVATVTNAGVVAGVSVGGTTIKYTVTDANGCSNSANHILTVNALPAITAITGTNTVCVGATTALTSSTIGGSWNSNNTAIATVDGSGVVAGVANGVTIINYTVNNPTTGCQSTVSTSVTVNALPILGSINGSSFVCVNSTTTLSNTTTGGSWSSSNIAAATIDNAGMVTAVAAGTTTIKYTVSNGSGCVDSVSKTVTVNDNPVVTAITAAPSLCAGSNIIASNITSGGVWGIVNTSIATISLSGLVNGVAAGSTTITYTVTDAATTCSTTISSPLTVNTPAVAPITGVNALCPLSTSILATTTIGGVWSSTDPSVATVDANTGLVTAIANGVATITYKVPVGNACGDSASTLVTVNTTLSIAPITGDSSVCNGSGSTLASVTLGGVWTSSNLAVATIDATTGVATSVGAGTSTITYNVTSGAGCSNAITTTYTVNALPATPDFTLATSSCIGNTLPLAATINGGVWSSSNASIASVDATGNLTGVSVGSASITYTLTNAAGCSSLVSKSININALPVVAAITGSSTVCLGSSITLSNDSTGGVWSTLSLATVATINASTGVVTTIGAGSVIFDYTITNAAGCVATVSKSVTVFDIPTVDTIVGGNSVCVGSTITLASPTSNGVWSSLTPFVASIDNAGVLTGNSNGGTTIKYTVTDATTTCSNFASLIVTVNGLPIVPAITGANAVCLNSTTTLGNTTAGGVWSSNNTSIATVDNAGLVNGVGAGTATITYSVTNASGCSTAVTTDVTVNVATSSSTTQTSCDSYLWNGTTYTASGTYTFNTTNANGCDSVATLILTINHSTSSNTSQTACNSYTWNGTTYTTSGQYYFTSTNASGCSNTDTLNLTVNYATSSNTSQTACNSFTWNGTTYTTSGQYYFNSTNASGCNNIDTLNLTVNYSTSSNTSQTACNSYTWNGTTYTTSGQYYFNSTNASGCSNIDTLNLTIYSSTSVHITTSACDSMTWNGTTYYTSGQYYFTSTNGNGCNTVDTLDLTINNAPAKPTINSSVTTVTAGQTGVAYTCSTVANGVVYTWSYTGTGVTINNNGSTSITADFNATATSGYIQVNASSINGCTSANDTVFVSVTPLPVVLSSFVVTKANNTAVLKWITATEINSKNFEVQRSIDGRTFTTIGTVEAKGFASDYTFVDAKPLVGINYYRLKQVDNNGKFEYSIVRTINFKPEAINVSIYPNPVADILNVRIANGEAKQINILSAEGKVIYATTTINIGGSTQIPVRNLNAGTYFVEILTTNNSKQVEKFVKR